MTPIGVIVVNDHGLNELLIEAEFALVEITTLGPHAAAASRLNKCLVALMRLWLL